MNVGGIAVKSAELRELFVELGFDPATSCTSLRLADGRIVAVEGRRPGHSSMSA